MSDKDPDRDDLAGTNAAHPAPTDDAAPGRASAAQGDTTDPDQGAPAPEPDPAADGGPLAPQDQDTPARTPPAADPTAPNSPDASDEDSGSAKEAAPTEEPEPDARGAASSSRGERAEQGEVGGSGARESVVVAAAARRPGRAGDGLAVLGDAFSEEGADESVDGGDEEPPRRRRGKVLRRTALGLVLVLLAGAAGAGWLYRDLVGGIEQKDVGGRLGENRPKKLNKSLNILLLGSDSREGDNSEYAVPGMSGARSDTAILLHLSPNRDQAVGISFPRDSMVRIPECRKDGGGSVPGRFGMLNSAFAFGGPTCTWKTLEALTGIHIDHFVQVDFSGFKRMVDALGGVEICVDRPVNDPRAELVLKAGKQTVKGDQALGYVRARYSLGNGSDLERIERQQKFMAAVVEKATDSVLSDPAKTYRFLKAATASITTDDDLDLSGMRKLADGLRGMSAGQVRFVTVPVERYAPDPNRVQWNQRLAKPLFEAVRHDNDLPAAPPKPAPAEQGPPPPGEVNVAVVDAGAKDAQVKRIVKQLEKRGYKVAGKVEKGAEVPETRLLYADAAEAQASTLARDLPDALLTADPSVPADGVRLVIGENGVRVAPPPPISKIRGGVKAGEDLCG